MNKQNVVLFVINLYYAFSYFTISDEKEERRFQTIVELTKLNYKSNGWLNIIFVGTFPDSFYQKIQDNFTFLTLDVDKEEQDIENIVPYYPNFIIISCRDFKELEIIILDLVSNIYWHPLANIILLYHNSVTSDVIAKIIYILWYHKAANAILVTYNDEDEYLKAYHYNPYTDERSKIQNKYGCWSTRKSGIVINNNFADNFICVKGCHNITVTSEIRAFYFGTCIGFDYHKIKYEDTKTLKEINLFEDKCKNFNGFVLRTLTFDTVPFLNIEERNGSYILHNRDGMIWNTMSEIMNFSMDYSTAKHLFKKPFIFDVNVKLIFDFAKRYADLLILPVYQFDVIVVEVDYTVPYSDSGVCIVSHRADFQTVLVDEKIFINNYENIIRFIISFNLLWMAFFFFNVIEKKKFTLDQLGKDFMNTLRSALSINLHRPPAIESFRIVMTASTWAYFLLNFTIQAAIISFFAAHKRGKEVDTFEDVIQKGYFLEGVASPDVLLPDTEERFQKINNKIIPAADMFQCLDLLKNDSRRFCLNDCAVARFHARNTLDDKGEQYLHVATQDRMHSHYLNMFLHKHSPMTDNYNIYIQRFIEAGLIKKWEEYRFNDLKETSTAKPLSMTDYSTIFKTFCVLQMVCCIIFMIEVGIGRYRDVIDCIKKWGRRLVARKKVNLERKLGNIKFTHSYTQTDDYLY